METRKLNVLVVGAGLGGLAAALALQTDGHSVTVLEAASKFGEVGAGIHLPPNSSRLLLRWGVKLPEGQSIANTFRFIRYDGSAIAEIPLENTTERQGAPYYLVHRADLHHAILEAARNAGVSVISNVRVVSYDFEAPTATTADGRVYEADLIIGADGVKSTTRPLFTGQADKPRDTGDIAYRILFDASDLCQHSDLASLLEDQCVTAWCGPGAHFIGYPVRGGQQYNLVICATSPNELACDAWVAECSTDELRTRFAGWEPRVRKLCGLARDVLKWRLCDLPGAATWVHPSGRAALLGDSCHPMLPYLAQGAAMAVEDAAVLRQCLGLPVGVAGALRCYEDVRMPRVARVQEGTREHQRIWHMKERGELVARDERMRRHGAENPVFWGHDERRDWLFGHDADKLDMEGCNWRLNQTVSKACPR